MTLSIATSCDCVGPFTGPAEASHHMLNFHPAGKIRKFRVLFPSDLGQAIVLVAKVERGSSRNCWLMPLQHERPAHVFQPNADPGSRCLSAERSTRHLLQLVSFNESYAGRAIHPAHYGGVIARRKIYENSAFEVV